ncbi:MAG: hypothetical protein IBX70_06620 [Clostridia bacterium]|nr:hypothetical protein [Clostridia bacterium]
MIFRIRTLLILPVLAILLYLFSTNSPLIRNVNAHVIPTLPRPIAKETILVTSAGQSTDTYIIKDISNKLMIHNFFMPQAENEDLENINTIVFVIGYSPLSEKVNQLSLETELIRIESLLNYASMNDVTVISVFIGGKQRRASETDEMLENIIPNSHYIISTFEGDFDHFISELARQNDIPLTLVENITDVSEPFASAFR